MILPIVFRHFVVFEVSPRSLTAEAQKQYRLTPDPDHHHKRDSARAALGSYPRGACDPECFAGFPAVEGPRGACDPECCAGFPAVEGKPAFIIYPNMKVHAHSIFRKPALHVGSSRWRRIGSHAVPDHEIQGGDNGSITIEDKALEMDLNQLEEQPQMDQFV